MRLLISITIFIFSCITQAEETAIDQRIQEEKELQDLSFSLIPHKPNYLLPFVFNEKISSYDIYPENESGENEMQDLEVEFQISFKIPIVIGIADLPISVYFGYTQMSFWQAYNTDNSSPFRETNYEPELFATWQLDKPLLAGWEFKFASAGFTHQSNGRTEPLSRSWNRLNADFVFENGNFVVSLNPWMRFSEDESEDNNPDLIDYYGHGKVTLAYKLAEHTFSLISRNNLESGFSKGSVRASWSFPLHNKVRGYFQIFSGYGNSLLEYNEYTNTVGIGISLTDWL
ncbi:phospholipase A [Psychromonas sp. KJ10-10]|uniref:phospholipase A n=1 Tax=Psychromonas sp. KJ10-10 TaxID=3391823 RepID=UPI0039B38A29